MCFFPRRPRWSRATCSPMSNLCRCFPQKQLEKRWKKNNYTFIIFHHAIHAIKKFGLLSGHFFFGQSTNMALCRKRQNLPVQHSDPAVVGDSLRSSLGFPTLCSQRSALDLEDGSHTQTLKLYDWAVEFWSKGQALIKHHNKRMHHLCNDINYERHKSGLQTIIIHWPLLISKVIFACENRMSYLEEYIVRSCASNSPWP